jgi:hypothetical protein
MNSHPDAGRGVYLNLYPNEKAKYGEERRYGGAKGRVAGEEVQR